MHPHLFPESELFSFTKSSFVLYVEDTYSPEANNFIQENYKQIAEVFKAKNIDFCYLPYLLHNENYQAVVNYNRPYLRSSVGQLEVQRIYDKLISKQKKQVQGSGLLLSASFGFFHRLIVFSFNDANVSLDLFTDQVKLISDYIEKTRNNLPVFQIVSKDVEIDDEYIEDLTASLEINESKVEYKSRPEFKRIVPSADFKFQHEAFKLADEIREKIKLLNEYGSLSLIGDVIEEIQGATKKLSVLFITNDYRIFLKDYGMQEVLMAPLPKSLFIIFLRHPEGILFKELSNYHDELLSIYRNITVHENIDRSIESIRAMTDPLNNSINEKCSRIRAAFLEIIADDLAQQYYVTGKRGEPKTIQLDRSLVEFQ